MYPFQAPGLASLELKWTSERLNRLILHQDVDSKRGVSMLVTESSVIVGPVLAERQWPGLTLGKCYLFPNIFICILGKVSSRRPTTNKWLFVLILFLL